jgi:membrane protease YdiL (CAAX protease family)
VSAESEALKTFEARSWMPAYQPRRPVPWQGIDLVVIVGFYISLQIGIILWIDSAIYPGILTPQPVSDTSQMSSAHSVVKLMMEGGPWTLALCFISAVLVAPITEEFLFRLLWQGWLEAVEGRWRRKMPWLRRKIPRGAVPIFLSALPFALMHIRSESVGETKRMVIQLIVMIIANGVTMAFAIGLLRLRVGATAVDFGWDPQKLRSDLRLGLLWFLAIVGPIYLVQIILLNVLPASVAVDPVGVTKVVDETSHPGASEETRPQPGNKEMFEFARHDTAPQETANAPKKNVAPDPVPLFLLALVLGMIYYRTHRLAPAIAIHAALNATSLTMVLLMFLLEKAPV